MYKGKVVPVHTVEAYGEWKYSSTHSYRWCWMELSSQLHASAALLPGR
jgi:hypothetical protein